MQEDRPVPTELLAGLNPEQARAVSHLHGPLVVVAGPGSGKTRVLTNRIAAIVQTGAARPAEVLAVTFTNKAAGEMRDRLGVLLGDDAVRTMWVCTFHSMCARLLRIEHEAAGLPRSFTILDTSDVRSVLRSVLHDLGLQDDAGSVRAAGSTISRVKNGASVRPDRRTGEIFEAYQQRLARLGAVDFDDLLLRALRLLEQDMEVLARYRRRFGFVLVDEYQDTNPVQYRLIQLLAAEHRNLCVVGDADQAIYAFRSASPEALLSFSADWPDAETVVLHTNYRSTPQILDVCRSLIAPNPAPHRADLRTPNADGPSVRLVLCPDDRDEAGFVTNELVKINPGQTAAILTRTNAQTRPFEEALMRARIRYVVVGTLRFYDRAEVKDALAYLRVLVNPLDAIALARATAAPRRGIGDKALSSVIELAAGGDLLHAAEEGLSSGLLGRGARGWSEFCTHIGAAAEAAVTSGPAAALAAVLDGGLLAFVRDHSGENAEDRVQNLLELVNAAKAFETDHRTTEHEDASPWGTTAAFLEHIALVSAADDAAEAGASERPVQLMTAHASKGKEFTHVYVVGVEEGFYPHARGNEEAPEDEERRLLFVACSRAEHALTLTAADRRMTYGSPVENPPSRFLADLPAEVRQIHRGSRAPQPNRGFRTAARPASRRHPATVGSPLRTQPPSGHAAGPRVAPADAREGVAVEHKAFGPGTIVSVDQGADGVHVVVDFATHGQKVLRLDLAPMNLAG